VLLVPVTVTVYAPAEPLQDRLEVPEPVTLVGVRVQVSPVEGEMLSAIDTEPLKPF
jgi:hypothetical protein